MPPVCMSACRLTACDLPARVPAAYFPGACLPACLRVCHLSSCHLTSSCLCPAAHPLAACSVPILPPVTLNPITKRHACAGSPLLASSIPILLAPHADLALLQANIIQTIHPWPDPPPPLAFTKLQNIHLSPVYLSPVYLSACRLTACGLPARTPAAYLPGTCLPACSSCPLTSLNGGGGEEGRERAKIHHPM
jgi:hypothetical protein